MAGGRRAIDHVSITCADLDASLGFYSDLLGIEVRGRGDAEGGEFAITGIEDPKVRWADLILGDGRVLELIEFVDPPGTPHRPQPNDPGATHISLLVADASAVHERLRDAGADCRSEPVTIEAPGRLERQPRLLRHRSGRRDRRADRAARHRLEVVAGLGLRSSLRRAVILSGVIERDEFRQPGDDLVCPRCRGRMQTHLRNGVPIDQCTECHGIFLDPGEFERLMAAEHSMLGRP